MYVQNEKRILVKTIIYRCIGIIIMLCVSFYITGNYRLSLGISFITELLQLCAYYSYECIWNNILWGMKKI